MQNSMLNPKNVFSFVAAGSIEKNHFVWMGPHGKVYGYNLADDGDDKAQVIGVAANDAKGGETVDVITSGIAQVFASTDIISGDRVYRARNGTAQADGGNETALTDVSDGGLVSILLK